MSLSIIKSSIIPSHPDSINITLIIADFIKSLH
jgi:hypothetical protein